MDQLTLYNKILQLTPPWKTSNVLLDEESGQITVEVSCIASQLFCPTCGEKAKRYDTRKRQWRHLDTCQFQTLIKADVPRVICKDHGCLTISVPWAEDSSRYTLLFENDVLNRAADTSILALTRQLKMSWNAIDGIIKRGVSRGLNRRIRFSCLHLFVDETCIAKPREFITVLSNHKGQVLAIEDGRSSKSLLKCFARIRVQDINKMKSISMDMSSAYKKAVEKRFGRRAEKLIAYDHFHLTKMLNETLSNVRKRELRSALNIDQIHHYKTRFLWFRNNLNRDEEMEAQLAIQRQHLPNTATVWYFKEQFRMIWKYHPKTLIKKTWKAWITLAKETGIRALICVVETIENSLQGILNAMKYGVSNGRAEAINNNIKSLGRRSRGYRNKERYKTAIMFHFGQLDMSHHH